MAKPAIARSAAREAGELIRVALIAPDSVYRNGLEIALRELVWVELIAVATPDDGARLLARTNPEIVIVRTASVSQGLSDAAPRARFILMEMPESLAEANLLIEQGVAAFVSPDSHRTNLEVSLRAVASGHVLLPPSSIPVHPAPNSEHAASAVALDALTEREGEVLGLIARGFTDKAIGRELNIAESTAKTHVHSILQKLHVRSRGGAAVVWARCNAESGHRERGSQRAI